MCAVFVRIVICSDDDNRMVTGTLANKLLTMASVPNETKNVKCLSSFQEPFSVSVSNAYAYMMQMMFFHQGHSK